MTTKIDSIRHQESEVVLRVIEAHPRYGRYSVVRKLGAGGMGTTYLVAHPHLEELRVLKVMHSGHFMDATLREHFISEAKSARRVSHPNVVQVFDVDVSASGGAVLEMEYIEGVTVAEMLSAFKSPFPFEVVVDLVKQAVSGIAALHTMKIVHGDISPDNMMVSFGGQGEPTLKIIDLGVATSPELGTNPNLGSFFGKIGYAAPERFQGTNEFRSDIYSLGLVVYEMIAGARRFREFKQQRNDSATLRANAASEFAALGLSKDVPDSFRHLVLQSLERDLKDRPSNISAWGEAVAKISSGNPLHRESILWLERATGLKVEDVASGRNIFRVVEQAREISRLQAAIDEIFPAELESSDSIPTGSTETLANIDAWTSEDLYRAVSRRRARLARQEEHLRDQQKIRRLRHFMDSIEPGYKTKAGRVNGELFTHRASKRLLEQAEEMTNERAKIIDFLAARRSSR